MKNYLLRIVCPFCPNKVEDEKDILLKCVLVMYGSLFSSNENFKNLSECEQLKYLFTNPMLIRCIAQAFCKILDRR